MKHLLQKTVLIIIIAVAVLTPLSFFRQGGFTAVNNNFAFAATNTNQAVSGLKGAAQGTGLESDTNLIDLVAIIVRTLLGFLGLIFIILLLYGGAMRMFARGEPEKVKTSTAIIKNAIIGVVIILASYIITSFVIGKVYETTSGASTTDNTGTYNNNSVGCCQTTNASGQPIYITSLMSDCVGTWAAGSCP
jgi:hypothetical protein